MDNKRYICPHCRGDFVSSQSRWNHKKRCKKNAGVVENLVNHQQMLHGEVSNIAQFNDSYKKMFDNCTKRGQEHGLDDSDTRNDYVADVDDVEIPEFDGAEFMPDKLKSRETVYKMMKLLKIPEEKWESIATDFMIEERQMKQRSI